MSVSQILLFHFSKMSKIVQSIDNQLLKINTKLINFCASELIFGSNIHFDFYQYVIIEFISMFKSIFNKIIQNFVLKIFSS